MFTHLVDSFQLSDRQVPNQTNQTLRTIGLQFLVIREKSSFLLYTEGESQKEHTSRCKKSINMSAVSALTARRQGI